MPKFRDLGCGLVGAYTDRLTTVITRAFARHDKSPSVPLVPRCGVFDDCRSVSPFIKKSHKEQHKKLSKKPYKTKKPYKRLYRKR